MNILKRAEQYQNAGFSRHIAYAKAYRDIAAIRTLAPLDEKTSVMPLEYDANAMAFLRPDQVPRFLGALTHPEIHPVKVFRFEQLTAIQNRVDTAKAYALATQNNSGPAGIVGGFNNKFYILDGHHRTIGRWLSGDDSVEMHFIDLNPLSNAMKSSKTAFCAEIQKMDFEKRLVYGFASVIEKDGQTVVDYHGDTIEEETLLKAAHDFIVNHRAAKVMHNGVQVGEFVESAFFSKDVQISLKMDLGFVGWWVCLKVTDETAWQQIKSGELKMFSIGGTAIRTVDNDE